MSLNPETLLQNPELLAELQKTVAAELWRRGDLTYKLHETQKKIYDAIHGSGKRRHFLLCSRRLGKSFLLLLIAFEVAIKKQGARVLFLAAHAKDAAYIATDLAAQILQDCPADQRPDYNGQEKEFRFANGSIIRLRGVNNEHANNLRGGAADLVILDECAIMDNLKVLLDSVVSPMTITTQGKILLATTPATTPDHESAVIYEKLAGQGLTSVFTIRDAPHIPEHVKAEYLVDDCGEDPDKVYEILRGALQPSSTSARREYFCEWVTENSVRVVPEFTPEIERKIVRTWPRASHYDTYVAMDPGFSDRTGVLFAWFDFAHDKIIIEDEVLLHQAGTPKIAEAISNTEDQLWGGREPFIRVSDIDKRLIADLWELHKLRFVQAYKGRSEEMLDGINLLRTLIGNEQVIINPKCQNLIRQLRNATWKNEKAKDFARTEKSGHYDLVAAAKYLVRSVIRTKNPYPSGHFRYGGPFRPRGKDGFESPRPRRAANTSSIGQSTPIAKRLRKR